VRESTSTMLFDDVAGKVSENGDRTGRPFGPSVESTSPAVKPSIDFSVSAWPQAIVYQLAFRWLSDAWAGKAATMPATTAAASVFRKRFVIVPSSLQSRARYPLQPRSRIPSKIRAR